MSWLEFFVGLLVGFALALVVVRGRGRRWHL